MTDLFAVETRADERAAVKLAANNKLTVACYVKRQLIGDICTIERQSLGNDRAERKLSKLLSKNCGLKRQLMTSMVPERLL